MSPADEDEEKGYERKALKVHGIKLFALAFSTLGIIYSDIGTSPLYVLNGIWPASGPVPPEEDIIGGLSAIIWSLTLLPLLKYVVIALEFGTGEGEGGPFALFMTLFPKPEYDGRNLTTYPTIQSRVHADENRLGKLARFRWPLMVWAIFGTGLTLADGVLTPAVSVVSAVEGIAVAKPSVANATAGVSIAFLFGLFAIQRVGTQKISLVFAPVTAIWLALLGATGIYNITTYPGIWRAYDPSRAIMWFVRTKDYDQLSGVLLAITGCEAMFANLGQFNKAAIRIGFGMYAYPMLILAYLGQGAKLINDASVINNVFYLTIPGKTGGALYWIVFVFGILATLIASQAMITGTFSLVHQLIGMQSFPAVRIEHTSSITPGQVYIGVLNWLLMIGTIAVVGGFGSNTALTSAYGFAVATVLFVTTTLIAISIPFVKHLPYVLGLAFFIFFGFLDGLFWGAALKKVPHGAWFPLGLGGILTILMAFWTWGRELEESFDNANNQKLSRIIVNSTPSDPIKVALPSSPMTGHVDEELELHTVLEGQSDPQEEEVDQELNDQSDLYLKKPDGDLLKLERIPVMAIFHRNDSAGKGVPHSFASFLQRYPALPQVVIFLSTRVVAIPYVPLEDRYTINKVRSVQGFFTITMRMGYLDRAPPSASEILPTLIALEARSSSSTTRIALIQAASGTTTHVVPSYWLISRTTRWRAWSWVRRLLVEEVYGRARVVFPDPGNAPDAVNDNTIHVAVAAVI